MRRVFILLLLLAGMHLIRPLAGPALGPETLLVFGFLILAAYTVGELAPPLGLPRMIGYLAAGIFFGPYVLGTVTVEAAQRLDPVTRLAIALIAFLAGAELRWSELRAHGAGLLRIMSVELALAFVALAGTFFLLRDYVPYISEQPDAYALAFSFLFASIAIAHSPAATMALLTETKARGDVARTTLGVVLISDIAVVVLFSIALGIMRFIVPPPGGHSTSMFVLIWDLVGALVVGAALGAAVAAYIRFVSKELVLFAVLVAFFGSELAGVVHVDPLLCLLVAGFVTENVRTSSTESELMHSMERAAAPVYVVFFALAGAAIDLQLLRRLIVVTVPLVIVRAFAIWLGTRIGARWAGVPAPVGRKVWLGLVAQAGVAIGLANLVAQSYPNAGPALRTALLALIAVNQLIGPILFRHALTSSGEANGGERAAPLAGTVGHA